MWKKLIQMWKSDNLLEKAWNRSFEMLNITHEMFIEATKTLRETEDRKVSDRIREKDKIVNQYMQEVRRQVLTHCVMQGPNELPGGLVLVSIVIDIERLGDYTKNIIEMVEYYPDRLKGGECEDILLKIETAVKDNFIRTKTCIESNDQEAALTLLNEYNWVSRFCDQCLYELIQEKDKKISPGQAASLALYMRWLKRINSHLRNITTSIVNPFDRIGFNPEGK